MTFEAFAVYENHDFKLETQNRFITVRQQSAFLGQHTKLMTDLQVR